MSYLPYIAGGAALGLAARGRRASTPPTLYPSSVPPNFNPSRPYILAPEPRSPLPPVLFNPRVGEGIGSTGWNHNINYQGFVTWITPSDFLRLSPLRDFRAERSEKKQTAKEYLRAVARDSVTTGIGLGPPFIQVTLDKKDHPYAQNTPSSEPYHFRVYSHEGRGRMTAMSLLGWSNIPIPVHIFPVKVRAHHLNPNRLLGATIQADSRSSLPAFTIEISDAVIKTSEGRLFLFNTLKVEER